ncbi:MAG: PQQ-dependent sugar dehydrogenase [Candidatus Magasanikbacteria bacterium]|nr:PQQ-dependent sugar dehydrogenase [Candidatus Magasanikbacteria bacterium]
MFNFKKILWLSIICAVALLLIAVGKFYYQNLRGIGPAVKKPPLQIASELQKNNNLLSVPAGFSVEVFAYGLPGARVLLFDNEGNLWVSQTGEGVVSKLIIKDNKVDSQQVVFNGLQRPHGLVFDPQNPKILYIAEENKISQTEIGSQGPGSLKKIIDLPKGGNHFTRTLGFGPEGRLYVSIGSTCNVCNEKDPRYASIWSLNKDGSDFKQVAKGLRNSVFFVFKDNKIWATEMGRDLLGDDIPPDEINVIDIKATTTLNYGWPICYGQNIHDTNFDNNTYFRNPCLEPFEKASQIDLQAHSAPLGLSFVPTNSGWPKEFQGNLLVAFHGSWNRSVPTGYKVVRLILDDQGKMIKQEDFLTGWLTANGALGRPVDLVFDKSGSLFISDDKAGVIYKLKYNP